MVRRSRSGAGSAWGRFGKPTAARGAAGCLRRCAARLFGPHVVERRLRRDRRSNRPVRLRQARRGALVVVVGVLLYVVDLIAQPSGDTVARGLLRGGWCP